MNKKIQPDSPATVEPGTLCVGACRCNGCQFNDVASCTRVAPSWKKCGSTACTSAVLEIQLASLGTYVEKPRRRSAAGARMAERQAETIHRFVQRFPLVPQANLDDEWASDMPSHAAASQM